MLQDLIDFHWVTVQWTMELWLLFLFMGSSGMRSHRVVKIEPAGRTVFEFSQYGVVGVYADFISLRLEDHVTQP